MSDKLKFQKAAVAALIAPLALFFVMMKYSTAALFKLEKAIHQQY